MSTFIKALFAAPILAAFALIGALPYLLLVAGLIALHPWFTLSPAQAGAISSFITEFPTRFDWPAITRDIDVVVGVEAIVIGFFALLFLYRMQSSTLQMVGIAPARKLRALFLPAGRWLVLPGLVFIALGVAAVVIGSDGFADLGLPLGGLLEPVNTVSVWDYYTQHATYLHAMFAALLIIFVLFGIAMEQNSTGIRVRVHMVLRDIPSIIILGVVHGGLAVVATVYLFQGAQLLLPATSIDQFNTLAYALIANAILFFAIMSTASAFLLKRQLMKLIAYSGA